MNIYLSPHQDDVCFSIAHLASGRGGELVNLFTRSRYVAVDMALPSDELARVDVITRLRREEDNAFAEAVGLARHDLGLSEPALIGLGPFNLGGLRAEVDALSARLIPFVLSLLSRQPDPSMARLYCPMGIGGHRNHLSTLLTVRNAYDVLRRRCMVFLYEDLHYASNPRARRNGIRRAIHLFSGIPLSPIAIPISENESERKMRFIRLYTSQHRYLPRVVDYIPASGLAYGLHEMVWQASPRPSTA